MNNAEMRKVLFDEIHRTIDAMSQELIDVLLKRKPAEIIYPPNGGLSEVEARDLGQSDLSEGLARAISKLSANSAANVLFRIFAVLDGVADPHLATDAIWLGARLVVRDEEDDEDREPMLHDELFETWWAPRRAPPIA